MKIIKTHHSAIVAIVDKLQVEIAFDNQEVGKEWRRYIGKAQLFLLVPSITAY